MPSSLVIERVLAKTFPAPGKRSADKPAGADTDRCTVRQPQRFDPDQRRAGLQAEEPSEFARRRLLGCIDQLPARLLAAGPDNLGKSRARAQRIGQPRRFHIGAAAALGAHQAALRQRRQRPAHGVSVDAVGLRNLHLARQPLARGKAAIGDAAFDPVGDLPP